MSIKSFKTDAEKRRRLILSLAFKTHIDSYNPLDYTIIYANYRRTP